MIFKFNSLLHVLLSVSLKSFTFVKFPSLIYLVGHDAFWCRNQAELLAAATKEEGSEMHYISNLKDFWLYCSSTFHK